MLLFFILFFIFKDEREKELTDKGDQIIEKIEAFRQEHHKCSVLNKLTLSQSQSSKNLCLITMNQRKYCYYISM